MAPQSGHISNFCRPIGTVIELVNALCFQNDRRGTLQLVQTGPPPWTHLEMSSAAKLRNADALVWTASELPRTGWAKPRPVPEREERGSAFDRRRRTDERKFMLVSEGIEPL
jgi:hypothetical protein